MPFRPTTARQPQLPPTAVAVPGYTDPFDPLAYGWDGIDLRRNITVGVMAAAARWADTAGGPRVGAVGAAMTAWDTRFPESAKLHRADILARLDALDPDDPNPETQAPEEIPF